MTTEPQNTKERPAISLAEMVVRQSDRLVFCTSCGYWDATKDTVLPNCRKCQSPHIRQSLHEVWAGWYHRARGVIYMPLVDRPLPIDVHSTIAEILRLLQKKYKGLPI